MTLSERYRFYSDVRPLCVVRLREALNRATELYDRQLCNGLWTATQRNQNLNSSAICLIGLSRSGLPSDVSGLDQVRTLDALMELLHRKRYYRSLGLVIWANAVWGGMTLTDLLNRFDISLEELTHIMSSTITSEVAWFVSGLAHELVRAPQEKTSRILNDAIGVLLDRFVAETGLFYHAASPAPFRERLRKHVGTFADQIYAIQALSLAVIARGGNDGITIANKCAERVVSLQGDLGQWWWHYNIRKGTIAQAYPVYSVHQYGMAPMGLMTLAVAGGREFRNALNLSLEWLTDNELKVNMIDREYGTIWRDIEYDQGRVGRLVRQVQSVSGLNLHRDKGFIKLKVNYETWPYEWAWCLYAAALMDSTDKGLHLV